VTKFKKKALTLHRVIKYQLKDYIDKRSLSHCSASFIIHTLKLKRCSPSMTNDITIENLNHEQKADFNRLFWHSRRGMLELDVLLVPFLKEEYLNLSKADQALYSQLLECEDPDLFKWFMQHAAPEDKDLAHIVNLILSRVQPI